MNHDPLEPWLEVLVGVYAIILAALLAFPKTQGFLFLTREGNIVFVFLVFIIPAIFILAIPPVRRALRAIWQRIVSVLDILWRGLRFVYSRISATPDLLKQIVTSHPLAALITALLLGLIVGHINLPFPRQLSLPPTATHAVIAKSGSTPSLTPPEPPPPVPKTIPATHAVVSPAFTATKTAATPTFTPRPFTTPSPTSNTTATTKSITPASVGSPGPEPEMGTLKVFIFTKNGSDPKGHVEINILDPTNGSVESSAESATGEFDLPVGTYEVEVEYKIEPDPEHKIRSNFPTWVPIVINPLVGTTTTIPQYTYTRIYETVHSTRETIDVRANQATPRNVYLPFDEGGLKVIVRTDSGMVPKQESRIEISAPGWDKIMTRKPLENNEYDDLVLPTDLTYQVKTFYGTGSKPIEVIRDGITVAPDDTKEMTIELPPFEEGELTVLLRTETGRILDHEATLKITTTDQQGNEITSLEGSTKDEFSTWLLAGTYDVTVTYLDSKIRRENIELGASGITKTIEFPDTSTLTVVLRSDSGMVLRKEAFVAIYPDQGDEPLFTTRTTDEYSVRLLPGSYRIETKYEIAQGSEERIKDVVVESGKDTKADVTFPDLGELVIILRTETGRVVSRTGTVTVYDSIGREIDSRTVGSETQYSELLKPGVYDISYEYDIPSAPDPDVQRAEVRANDIEEVTINLPFDEGQIQISVTSTSSSELQKTPTISIYDEIGRGIDSVRENSYSAWLPVGRYEIVVEYGGVKQFDEMKNVKLDEVTLVEVPVSAE